MIKMILGLIMVGVFLPSIAMASNSSKVIDVSELPVSILGVTKENFLALVSLFFVAMSALIFSKRHVGFGIITVAVNVWFFWIIDWLLISGAYVALIWMIAVIFNLSYPRRKVVS